MPWFDQYPLVSIFFLAKLGVLLRIHQRFKLGWIARLHFDHPTIFICACVDLHDNNDKKTSVLIPASNWFWGQICFTRPGVPVSLELTSMTSPETGELTSLVALTLSTAPKLFPFVTDVPDSGSSTKTTSPRWPCKEINAVNSSGKWILASWIGTQILSIGVQVEYILTVFVLTIWDGYMKLIYSSSSTQNYITIPKL